MTRVLVAVVFLATVLTVSVAHALPTVTGPTATAERRVVELDSSLRVTLTGFQAEKVTLAFCGNEARRGSGDCNLPASMAEGLATDGVPTIITMRVSAPPVPCPCLVRVWSGFDDEVAVAPITLVGHPIGPVVDTETVNDPFVLSIHAEPADSGSIAWLRSGLGGPQTYRVTATVKNRSTVPLSVGRLSGSAGHTADDDLVDFTFDSPGRLEPGQTWTQDITATLPGPSFGSTKWHLAATTSGAPVSTLSTTTQRPTLLILVVLFLVADVFLLAIRFAIRRRQRSASGGAVHDDGVAVEDGVANLAA